MPRRDRRGRRVGRSRRVPWWWPRSVRQALWLVLLLIVLAGVLAELASRSGR